MMEAGPTPDAKALRRRREKPQLSCNLCRKSKLRCDRHQPCNNCTRKGLGGSCTFAHSDAPKPTAITADGGSNTAVNPNPSPNQSQQQHQHQQSTTTVKDRVKQLEDQVGALVEALKQQHQETTTTTTNTTPSMLTSTPAHSAQNLPWERYDGIEDSYVGDQCPLRFQMPLAETAGYIECTDAGVSYVGSSHWMAIMQGIPEIKDVLESHAHVIGETASSARDERDQQGEPDLLLGSMGNLTRQDVLDCLPPRAVADGFVAHSFRDTTNESMIVHPPTFRKEYERFWDNQSETPIVWIGLLFALMCLAVQYEQFSPNESRRQQVLDLQPERLIQKFRRKTIQCLIMGKYTNAPPYAVETLLLFVFSEALRGENTKNMNNCWALFGTVVRIAQRAGFHRDGSHFPALSPFRAEMRRRTWLIIVEWDMYLSTQFGLPRVIDHAKTDTRKPRNLLDEDLHEDMLELPHARPDSARTQPQFHGAKNRLQMVFARIQDMLSSIPPSPYADVLKLDSLLTRTYESLLPVWQTPAELQQATTDNPSAAYVCVSCSFLAFIYHRARITLHQRYMMLGRIDSRYKLSHKVCVEAAISILQLQWSLYLDTMVGGDLCRHGWKFLTLLQQDFLSGTAVLCAELGEEVALARCRSESDEVNSHSTGTVGSGTLAEERYGDSRETELRDRVVHALSGASIVWLQSRNFEVSQELQFLVAALKDLLNKAQRAGFGQTPSSSSMSSGKNLPFTSQARPGYDYAGESRHVEAEVYWGIGHFPV